MLTVDACKVALTFTLVREIVPRGNTHTTNSTRIALTRIHSHCVKTFYGSVTQ